MPVIPYRALAPVVVIAIVVPTAAVAAFRRGALLLSLAAWLVLGPATSIAAGVTGESLFADAFNAPRTLLTSALPVTATQGLLLWLFSVVWWAAFWTAQAVASTAARPLTLLAPTLLLAAGTAASVSVPAPATGIAVVFAAAAVFALRPATAGVKADDAVRLTFAIGVAVAAVQVSAWVPARAQPADPRAASARPVRTQQMISPLALTDVWAAGQARPMFRVRSGSALPLRLTVLDDYDGVEWTSDAAYIESGPRLPGASPAPAARPDSAEIELQGLDTAWLPAPDRPVELSGIPAVVDPADGVLAAPPEGAAAGLRYRVLSMVPQLSAAAAFRATPASGVGYARYLEVPGIFPAVMARAAERITARATSPYQELLLLQNALRSGYRYDPRATPGRTVGHLAFFYLTSHVGTADQFAATFALMARHLGFPARLAIGFTEGHPAGGGWSEVSSTDVAVWPEVALRNLGWVPFYPVPAPGHHGSTGIAEPSSRAAIDHVLRSQQQAAGSHPAAHQPVTGHGAAAAPRAGFSWPWVAVAGPALFAVLYLVFTGLARWRARLRDRSRPPDQQIATAWRLSVRELARLRHARPGRLEAPGEPAGVASLAAMTAGEIVTYTRQRLGPRTGETVGELAEIVSRSAFSPRRAEAGDAAAAWSAQRRLRADIGTAIGRRGRLRRSLELPWRKEGG
jgi:transglutaminase-like putative cysteine protease